MDYVTDAIYNCEISLGGEKYKLEHKYQSITSQDLELDLSKVSSNNIKVYSYTSAVKLEDCDVYFRTDKGGWASKRIYLRWNEGAYTSKEGEIDFNVSEIKPELQAGDVLTIQVKFPEVQYQECNKYNEY